jgi:glycosyltransferase involved in cell wall biosynthesis
MADPLVSIPILCHNYGRFLADAIESALAQTYGHVEVTVWDDGSTDATAEIAARYVPDVSVVSQENAGIARTCNRAVEAARGEWFAFLSADDRFEPTYIEELLAAIVRSRGAAFAYCDAQLFGAASGVQRALPFDPFVLVRANFVNGCALTRRDDFLALGGYDPALDGHGYEDWDFWLRMLASGRRGTHVPKPLLHWRRHENGSRNPTRPEDAGRAAALVRARHSELVERLEGVEPAPFAHRLAYDPRVRRSARIRPYAERALWRAVARRALNGRG